MTAPVPVEDDRRRRRTVAWLLLALGLLLLGIGGWQVLDGGGAAAPRVQAHPQPTPVVGSPRPVTGSTTGSSAGSHTGSAASGSGEALRLASLVRGRVAPESPATVEVTVTNTTAHPVVVTEVSGAVTSVAGGGSQPACRAGWYSVGSFTGRRVLAAGATTTVSLPLSFRDIADVNQDDCRGARYTYSVRAQGSSR